MYRGVAESSHVETCLLTPDGAVVPQVMKGSGSERVQVLLFYGMKGEGIFASPDLQVSQGINLRLKRVGQMDRRAGICVFAVLHWNDKHGSLFATALFFTQYLVSFRFLCIFYVPACPFTRRKTAAAEKLHQAQ